MAQAASPVETNPLASRSGSPSSRFPPWLPRRGATPAAPSRHRHEGIDQARHSTVHATATNAIDTAATADTTSGGMFVPVSNAPPKPIASPPHRWLLHPLVLPATRVPFLRELPHSYPLLLRTARPQASATLPLKSRKNSSMSTVAASRITVGCRWGGSKAAHPAREEHLGPVAARIHGSGLSRKLFGRCARPGDAEC